MWGLAVFVLIVILSSAVGAISQWLKAQKQAEQERMAQQRANPQARRDRPDATIDRYVEEVERLRRRPAGAPVAAQPTPVVVDAPTVVPVAKRKRVSDTGEASFTAPRSAPARLEDLPVAAVVPTLPPPPPPGRADATTRPIAAAGVRSTARLGPRAITAAGTGPALATGPLVDLLKSAHGPALAVMLNEVFGPPKCRQRKG